MIKEWILNKLLKKEKLVCQRCKMHEQPKDSDITVPSFVLVRGEIITNSRTAKVFTCPEQMFNYAQGIVMHSVCWIETLREHGIELYDMGKVYDEYAKKAKNGGT